VLDNAGLDSDLGGRHVPLRRRGCHQHLTRRRRGRTQLHPRVRDRGRTASALYAERQILIERHIGGGELGAHLSPFGIKFLGDDRAQPGGYTLPLVEMLDHDCDGVVRRDPDKGVGHRLKLGWSVRSEDRHGYIRRDHQRSAERGRGLFYSDLSRTSSARSVCCDFLQIDWRLANRRRSYRRPWRSRNLEPYVATLRNAA
jgi:hypothetical protein